MGSGAGQTHILICALCLVGFMISSVEKIFFLYPVTLASLSKLSRPYVHVHLSLDFQLCSVVLFVYMLTPFSSHNTDSPMLVSIRPNFMSSFML